MCLYPKIIINRKYTPTKKNGGRVPYMKDERTKYVAVGCGNCIECRKQIANGWRTRMLEEIKHNPKQAKFVTLTFTNESLEKLCKELQVTESNAIAGLAIRRFLERWRKQYKKSVKHWFITELGHEGTERIHLHGIMWTDESNEIIDQKWGYGYTYVGDFCNEKTINYIVKYVTKIDQDHKKFRGQIFCSAGIGRNYLTTFNAQQNTYKGINTKETYTLNNGTKIGLPIYYRNHIYSEEEREKLWINRLDKGTRYVLGLKIETWEDDKTYWELLKTAQEKNKRLGYGDDSNLWKKEDYNINLRKLKNLAKRRRKNLSV